MCHLISRSRLTPHLGISILSDFRQSISKPRLKYIEGPGIYRVVSTSGISRQLSLKMRFFALLLALMLPYGSISTNYSSNQPTRYGMIVFTGFQALGKSNLSHYQSCQNRTNTYVNPKLIYSRCIRALEHPERALPNEQHDTFNLSRIQDPGILKPRAQSLRLTKLWTRSCADPHVCECARHRGSTHPWRFVLCINPKS